MIEKTQSVEPVRKQVVVEVPQERAFRVFTEKFEQWWPREHHIGTAELKTAMIEPREGGRWYEIGVDGSECDWGKVLVWDPPRRLVLTWQLDAGFRYDPKLITEVEVRFSPEGPKRTRVELEHRNLERYGAEAMKMRGIFGSAQGWTGIIERYVKVAATAG